VWEAVTGSEHLCPENQGGEQGPETNQTEDYGKALPGEVLGLAEQGKPDCGGYPFRRASAQQCLHQPDCEGPTDTEQAKGKQGATGKKEMSGPVEMGAEQQHAEDHG